MPDKKACCTDWIRVGNTFHNPAHVCSIECTDTVVPKVTLHLIGGKQVALTPEEAEAVLTEFGFGKDVREKEAADKLKAKEAAEKQAAADKAKADHEAAVQAAESAKANAEEAHKLAQEAVKETHPKKEKAHAHA